MKQLFHKIFLQVPRAACLTWIFLLGLSATGFGQHKDSTLVQKVNSNKTVKKLLGFITRTPEAEPSLIHVKSEEAYLKYEGKIIRKIIIQRVGFEKTVWDTAHVFKSYVTKAANKLHANTRESVIRNNLFIRENKPLNPYRVADNERTLRNLDFILDARIYVKPVSKSADSVDLLVVTRDVFSLGGSVGGKFPRQFKTGVKNINVGGLGQRIDYRQVFSTGRTPRYGYELLYHVSNIQGSFINATAAYTKLDNGISIGNENEQSVYIRLTRDLYQPFARFAGAVELSDNISRNVYNEPDSTFIQYHYRVQDYWLGYSFGYKKLPNDLKENRNRKFFAIRAAEQFFINPATYVNLTEPDGFAYRNRAVLLAQMSFFRQDFYKTHYVAGFGRTEDIPYGYRISFTTGWEKELGMQRPYFGSELYYNRILATGTILTYVVRVGAYTQNKRIEDGLVTLNFTRYSKIHRLGPMVFRHQLEAGYGILFNQHIKRGINIRDLDGITGFRPDSLVGPQRMTLAQETTIFTPWKVLGFRLAAVARVDVALIKVSKDMFRSENFFSGFSVGLRAKNENLIFKTFEVRMFYYPTIVEQIGHFKVTITSNFTIKYPTNLVSKPATVFPQ